MKQYTTKFELELDLYILLDATLRGWLEGKSITMFTRAMLIGGDLLRRKGGNKIKNSMIKTFGAWIDACNKADERGLNRIVLTADQYKLVARHVNNISKVLTHTSDKSMQQSQVYVDLSADANV